MQDVSNQISGFASLVAAHAVPFLTAMAAIGVITMALIQTVKDLFPLRRAFQKNFVHEWLRIGVASVDPINNDPPASHVQAEADLVRLATNGDARALYDLPIEQLCGQINAAATLVLDFPRRHRDLLLCLSCRADPQDVKRCLDAAEQTQADLQVLQREQPAAFQDLVNARTRVMTQVQRSIDALQIAAGFKWKLYMQMGSFATSYLLTIIAVSYAPNATSSIGNALAAIPIGIVGGFLAPVARDLVAMLSPLRRS
jgi:hypothetical protein